MKKIVSLSMLLIAGLAATASANTQVVDAANEGLRAELPPLPDGDDDSDGEPPPPPPPPPKPKK